MTEQQPAPWVRKLAADGGLLLLDTASNCLSAYNSTAQLAWELLEQGGSETELVAGFATRCGIAHDLACKDVRAIIRQWRSQGLLSANGSSKRSTKRWKAPVRTDWSQAPTPHWVGTLTCTIRSTVFAFAIEPANLIDFVPIFFKHLETPDALPDVRIEIREAGENNTALVVDGIERLRTCDAGQLIGAVNQTILEQIHPGIEWLAIIHGAAVARDGTGWAIPAACGSGKTTLTAYLLARGYDYLADDHVALSAPDGRIVPWPLPMSIKEGSWDVLSQYYQNLLHFPQYRTKRGEARQLVPSAEVWDTNPVLLKGFIFPRYVSGAKATLTRLTPFDALQRLLGDQIWLGYPITEQHVGNFIRWLEDKPAYTLEHSNLADAALCIEGIV